MLMSTVIVAFDGIMVCISVIAGDDVATSMDMEIVSGAVEYIGEEGESGSPNPCLGNLGSQSPVVLQRTSLPIRPRRGDRVLHVVAGA